MTSIRDDGNADADQLARIAERLERLVEQVERLDRRLKRFEQRLDAGSPDTSPPSLTTRMKDRRLHLGLTQTLLAARARPMSSSDVSRIETGRQVPYPGQRRRLARALRLAPEELLDDVSSTTEAGDL